MCFKLKYEFLLLIIAAVLCLTLIFVMQLNYQTLIFGDSNSYILAAKELYLQGKLNDHRPLIISIINGFPLLFGFDEKNLFNWSLFVNIFCWICTILTLYKIGLLYLNKRTSFFLALCFICCFGNFFIIFHLLSETIFVFFLTFSIYLIRLLS